LLQAHAGKVLSLVPIPQYTIPDAMQRSVSFDSTILIGLSKDEIDKMLFESAFAKESN
jgi:hypothetical protein